VGRRFPSDYLATEVRGLVDEIGWQAAHGVMIERGRLDPDRRLLSTVFGQIDAAALQERLPKPGNEGAPLVVVLPDVVADPGEAPAAPEFVITLSRAYGVITAVTGNRGWAVHDRIGTHDTIYTRLWEAAGAALSARSAAYLATTPDPHAMSIVDRYRGTWAEPPSLPLVMVPRSCSNSIRTPTPLRSMGPYVGG
jgi:hypothetical protein